MNGLTDLEFRVLDDLYFVSSFTVLVQNLQETNVVIKAAIIKLLTRELIVQISFNGGKEERLTSPDLAMIEQSFYVASKQGLLLHNSRN